MGSNKEVSSLHEGNGEQAAVRQAKFSFRDIRLQTRLILLMLGISIPVILLSIFALSLRAEALIRDHTNQQLAQVNYTVMVKADTWFNMSVSVLRQLASLDDMMSMDPARQKPLLVQTAKAFPYMFLVQTINTSGFNVSRNDDQANKDYSDRDYFKEAMAGDMVAYQMVISRTNNRPALNMALPIHDRDGKMVGVVSFASELKDITAEVLKAGSGGASDKTLTFIVDDTNKVIVHPDNEVAAGFIDYSSYPPVLELRRGGRGVFEYTDDQGHRWLAYLTNMDNGWGVITQEDYALAFAPVNQFRLISAIIVSIAAVLLVVLAFVIIRRSLRPVVELTKTVSAVTAGDLNQVARVERKDEIGQLAQSFNSMNAQLRENITNLEQRVTERTRALTLSTEVSNRLSTILDLDQLTQEIVDQLQQAFHYYHVHIYLFDDARENLMMVGGTGEAGQLMLAREHKIVAGRGLVGRAAETNSAVLVSDTSQDPGWLPNPLLPDTKSELAVPISLGDQVLGVLDVQQSATGGLSQADVDLIHLVANQVAIALKNARIHTQTQQRAEHEALIASLGQKIQQASTIDDVLKVAVGELSQALGAQRASVELRSNASANGKN